MGQRHLQVIPKVGILVIPKVGMLVVALVDI